MSGESLEIDGLGFARAGRRAWRGETGAFVAGAGRRPVDGDHRLPFDELETCPESFRRERCDRRDALIAMLRGHAAGV